jgi:hypothetical protein
MKKIRITFTNFDNGKKTVIMEQEFDSSEPEEDIQNDLDMLQNLFYNSEKIKLYKDSQKIVIRNIEKLHGYFDISVIEVPKKEISPNISLIK